jgi:hypothetical protein
MYKKSEYLLLLIYFYITVAVVPATPLMRITFSYKGVVVSSSRYYISKSEKARKKAGPNAPHGAMPPLKQRKVQTFLQLLYANKALSSMKNNDRVSGKELHEAMSLRRCAIHALRAMASPIPGI